MGTWKLIIVILSTSVCVLKFHNEEFKQRIRENNKITKIKRKNNVREITKLFGDGGEVMTSETCNNTVIAF